MQSFSISHQHTLLEIGCGEGRDAIPILRQGFNLLATDISPEAVSFCKMKFPEFSDHFQTLDCVTGNLNKKFDFIYAVAVVHMLVPDSDRDSFYRFIHEHLNPNGIALICTMGNGIEEHQSDVKSAFHLQKRTHEQTGKTVYIAGTSCRIVSFQTFRTELERNCLSIIKDGVTSVEPDFPQMMFAVVKRL